MITTTFKPLGAPLKALAVSIALLGAGTGTAHAITTTLYGTNVDFTYDSSLTGLLGTPAVATSATGEDIFYFTPTTFKATATNSATGVSATQSLSLTITPHAGYVFDSLGYLSKGDYTLFGAGTNTVSVEGSLGLSNGTNSYNSPISAGALTTISPSMLSTTNWQAPLNTSLAGWGSGAINASLISTLKASSGTLAFIEQKYVGFQVMATPVPEVETWTMMLAGVGLIALQLRRRTGSEARAIG